MKQFSEPAPIIDAHAGSLPPKLSGLAIASLICGILSIVFSLLSAVAACVLGMVAIIAINQSEGRLKGKGLAITGMILSILFSLASITTMWFVRETAREALAENNAKQLAFAMLNYESAFHHFPNDVLDRETGKPLLSWRVAILPYLECHMQYEQFRLDEPWDSPANLEAAKNMPEVFKRAGAGTKEGFTTFQRPVGNGAIFELNQSNNSARIGLRHIRDGQSNTFMIAETQPESAVFWTQPTDYHFDPADPAANLGASKFGWLLFALGDGSTIRLKKNVVSTEQLKSMFTRAGGEVVDMRAFKKPK